MKVFWGRSVANLVGHLRWFSKDDGDFAGRTYRAYYGFRIGPFLFAWTRWRNR
jgi:hypothetical protein